MEIPLLEDDLGEPGLVGPGDVVGVGEVPRRAVVCFFPEVVEAVGGTPVARLGSAEPRTEYAVDWKGERLASFHPGIGAPAACCALEEAIALGCREFVVVGGSGALRPELRLGQAVVVDRALRDEGTSYHYLPASRFVAADPDVTAPVVASLEAAGLPYVRGTTWTTDAIYRETRSRLRRRVAEGCLTVEMEAAAFFAVARFRGVRLGQLLYAGDTLAGEDWDSRGWVAAVDVRRAMFEAALDAAASLPG